MADHVRIAVYTIKQGTAEDVAKISHSGMLPIYKAAPGFVRYGVGLLDDGRLVAVNIWKTHEEAEAATRMAADFVAEHLADLIELENTHVGDFVFDESA